MADNIKRCIFQAERRDELCQKESDVISKSGKSGGSQNKEPNTSNSRGYSFDLDGIAASADKIPE